MADELHEVLAAPPFELATLLPSINHCNGMPHASNIKVVHADAKCLRSCAATFRLLHRHLMKVPSMHTAGARRGNRTAE